MTSRRRDVERSRSGADAAVECAGSSGLLGDRVLLVLLAVGIVLRLVVGFVTLPDRVLLGDESTYIAGSHRIARTGVIDTGAFVRPPLYFLALAAIHHLPTPFLPTLIVLQCLASVATGVVAYRATLRMASRRAARYAAAFLLLSPTLIGYSHLVWPESFYLLGVSLVFVGVAELRPDRPWRAVGLGALTGLCMLLKPVFGLFALVLAVWWWRRFGTIGAGRLSVVFGLAAALVISPWLVRNQLRYGGSILLENQAAYNLWIGNDLRPPTVVLREFLSIPDQTERARIGFMRGLQGIEADPAGFAGRYARRAVNIWGLEYFVLRHVVVGGYGPTSKGAMTALFWTLQLGHAALLIAAALGIGAWPRRAGLAPILAYAAVFTALVAAMVGTTRFAVPFALPLAVSAGLGLVSGSRLWRERRTQAALAVVLLLLAVSATRSVFHPFYTGDFAISEEQAMDWFFFRY